MTSHIGLGLEIFEGPSNPSGLLEAILAFYDATKRTPQQITFRNPNVRHRFFKPRTLATIFADPSVPSVSIAAESENIPWVHAHLRFVPDPLVPGTENYEKRWFAVTMPGPEPPVLAGPLLELLRAAAELLPIVQGSVGAYRSAWPALHECRMASSMGEVDEETRLRIKEDDLSWTPKRRRLRRLYPVTIIGPELWAELPPMPEVTPAPRVEDLGACKMITVWPTLCHPRDPAFLRGTRELRAWLWPYTIKNPADALERDP